MTFKIYYNLDGFLGARERRLQNRFESPGDFPRVRFDIVDGFSFEIFRGRVHRVEASICDLMGPEILVEVVYRSVGKSSAKA
jgi:hypothetical protein